MDIRSFVDLWVAGVCVGLALRWITGWNVELTTAVLAGAIIVTLLDSGFQTEPLAEALFASAPELIAGLIIGFSAMLLIRSSGNR